MGIEPTSEAWEASILPLYDARSFLQLCDYTQRGNGSYRPAISPVFQIHPRQTPTCTARWSESVCGSSRIKGGQWLWQARAGQKHEKAYP